MNELKTFKKILNSKLITREAVARAFRISKPYTYQISGGFVEMGRKMKEDIQQKSLTVIEEKDGVKVTVIIEID